MFADPAAQKPQNGVGGALTHIAGGDALFTVAPAKLVRRLDKHGKADGGVKITLGQMEAETLDNQAEADHQEKTEAENDHGRMFRHESHQRPGCCHHHGHGHADSGNHHPEIIDHADSGDDAVKREHGIEHDDLGDDLPEDRMHYLALFRLLITFQPFVQLHGSLGEQEGAAKDEDEIAPREGKIRDGEKRPRQRDDP
ncbi:hypothetical protein D3C72_1363140 [compost metagenome]